MHGLTKKCDAVQDLSYQGVLKFYHQGNKFLGAYEARIFSIHDSDGYLASAKMKVI